MRWMHDFLWVSACLWLMASGAAIALGRIPMPPYPAYGRYSRGDRLAGIAICAMGAASLFLLLDKGVSR